MGVFTESNEPIFPLHTLKTGVFTGSNDPVFLTIETRGQYLPTLVAEPVALERFARQALG